MGMKICLLVGWILFFIVTIKIFSAMKADLSVKAAYVIVLGAQVRGTRITGSLMRRLDSACHYLKLHPETKVIVSGGQGKGEDISEAEAMAEELKRRGIARERIIEEDRSTSTEENLRFSADFIGDMTEPVMLVTNNFHICRALMLGKKVGYTCLYGIAATSNPVLFLNYMVREFFAVLLTKVRSML